MFVVKEVLKKKKSETRVLYVFWKESKTPNPKQNLAGIEKDKKELVQSRIEDILIFIAVGAWFSLW